MQILPSQGAATGSHTTTARKSILLKNPGGGSTPPRILTISPENVKPYAAGKIVGKVPPGMLRLASSPSSTVIKQNQVCINAVALYRVFQNLPQICTASA